MSSRGFSMNGLAMISEGGKMVLAEIPEFVTMWGYSPSVRDIGQALGLSPSGVWHHLERLAAAGLVTWTPGRSRTIRLTKEGTKAVKL